MKHNPYQCGWCGIATKPGGWHDCPTLGRRAYTWTWFDYWWPQGLFVVIGLIGLILLFKGYR